MILGIQIGKINLGKFSFCGKEKPLSFQPYPLKKKYIFAKVLKIKSVCVLITAEEKIMWRRYVYVYFRSTCFAEAPVKH